VLLVRYLGEKVTEDEMSGTCFGVWGENILVVKEGELFEDLGVDGSYCNWY
jgi:hypothetical protein